MSRVETHEAAYQDFFDSSPGMKPVFEALRQTVFGACPGVSMRRGASQLGFYCPSPFLAVWLPIRKTIRGRPPEYLIVSLFSTQRIDSPRMESIIEPYPKRWTHHIILSNAAQIDDELVSLIQQAYCSHLPEQLKADKT